MGGCIPGPRDHDLSRRQTPRCPSLTLFNKRVFTDCQSRVQSLTAELTLLGRGGTGWIPLGSWSGKPACFRHLLFPFLLARGLYLLFSEDVWGQKGSVFYGCRSCPTGQVPPKPLGCLSGFLSTSTLFSQQILLILWKLCPSLPGFSLKLEEMCQRSLDGRKLRSWAAQHPLLLKAS